MSLKPSFLPIMLKRLTITGSTLRIRPVEVKGAIAKALKERVWPHIESGDVAPMIHATFPLERADEAHRLMEKWATMTDLQNTHSLRGDTGCTWFWTPFAPLQGRTLTRERFRQRNHASEPAANGRAHETLQIWNGPGCSLLR